MKRTCRNCVHCLVETKECHEGGYTEIGDLDLVQSEVDCNAWEPVPDVGGVAFIRRGAL